MSAHLLVDHWYGTADEAADRSLPIRPFGVPEADVEGPSVGTETDGQDVASELTVLEIRRRLCSTGYHVLRLIECECSDGTVVLRGRVPTYYYKQVAQAVLLTHPAVKAVVNSIEVYDNGHEARHNRRGAVVAWEDAGG